MNVSFFGNINLQGNSILDVGSIRGMFNKWSIDENGNLIAKEIETQKLKAETGVTTRDRTTGDYYCIFVDNGTVKSEKGICGESVLQPTPPPSPELIPEPIPLQEESTSTTTATSTSP